MILTRKQRNEIRELAKPLIQWLNNNGHPHCELNVTNDSVEFLESCAREIIPDFIKD